MSGIEIMPFFDMKEEVFDHQVFMPEFKTFFKGEKYNDYTVYESSLLVNIDFRGEDNDFWKTFAIRAATPIKNAISCNSSEYSDNEKDEVTLFIEEYMELIKKDLPNIETKDYRLLDILLRGTLDKHGFYTKSSKNITSPYTLTFTLDFGPSMDWALELPNPSLQTGIQYGMFIPSSTGRQNLNATVRHENRYHISQIPSGCTKFFLSKVKPSCDKLRCPIPVDAIRNLGKGEGDGEYFRDIMLSLTEVVRLAYGFYFQTYFGNFKDAVLQIHKNQYNSIDLNYSLEACVIMFELRLILKCLEKSKFSNADNAPVFLHDAPTLDFIKESSSIHLEYNACLCFPSASWIGGNSNKAANVIGAVGMRLSGKYSCSSNTGMEYFLKMLGHRSSENPPISTDSK